MATHSQIDIALRDIAQLQEAINSQRHVMEELFRRLRRTNDSLLDVQRNLYLAVAKREAVDTDIKKLIVLEE